MSERIDKIRLAGSVYLIVNTLYLLPTVFYITILGNGNPLPDFVRAHFYTAGLYDAARLPIVHFVLIAAFAAYSVYRFIKNRKPALLVSCLSLSAAAAALNLFWLIEGMPYTVQ